MIDVEDFSLEAAIFIPFYLILTALTWGFFAQYGTVGSVIGFMITITYPSIGLALHMCHYINQVHSVSIDYDIYLNDVGVGKKYPTFDGSYEQWYKDAFGTKPIDRLSKQEILLLLLACVFYPITITIFLFRGMSKLVSGITTPVKETMEKFK